MATVANSNSYLTLLDHAKRLDPNGAYAPIIETLSQQNSIIKDAAFREGNLITGHRVTRRLALPSLKWRRLNEGIPSSKSKTGQVDETVGSVEGLSIVDTEEAELNGDPAAFRATEDVAFMASMQNEVETGMFYHSTKSAPEKFDGLATRLDATTNPFGSQILKMDASASGNDQASVWIVGWGPNTIFGIIPKGGGVGLQHKDLGVHMQDDGTGSGAKFPAYHTHWKWKLGLCVQDARYLVRIANIDTSNLLKTGHALIDAISTGIEQMQDTESCRPIIYCNRTIRTYLKLQAADRTSQSTLTFENVGGRAILNMEGIPIRRTDALLNNESVVS
jgi:hypothetical protein